MPNDKEKILDEFMDKGLAGKKPSSTNKSGNSFYKKVYAVIVVCVSVYFFVQSLMPDTFGVVVKFLAASDLLIYPFVFIVLYLAIYVMDVNYKKSKGGVADDVKFISAKRLGKIVLAWLLVYIWGIFFEYSGLADWLYQFPIF